MPRPILIDLYFTLIEPDPALQWFNASAELLGVTPAILRDASMPSFNDRMIGTITTPEEVINHALAQLGRRVDPETYARLVALRWDFFHGLRRYPDVLPALTTLRQRGHAIALVTNCSAETEVALDRLELRPLFDVLALSSSLKAAKPDPAIYQYAIDGLGIDPASAVYVGDGDTEEHAGAAHFGMTTVLLSRPGATVRNVQADYTIASLLELLDLPALQA